MTALSPLPEATRLGSTGKPLKPVKEEEEGEGGEEEVESPTVRTDDLSEDIVRLKDIREGCVCCCFAPLFLPVLGWAIY